MGKDQESNQGLYRIPPFWYIHVLDQTTHVTRIEEGPQTFVRKDNERVVLPPTKMIVIPPRHFCVIRNPVARNEQKELVLDELGQVVLQHAESEVRLEQPFSHLQTDQFVLADRLNFGRTDPWPVAADAGGHSLNRVSDKSYGPFSNSWTGSEPSAGSVEFRAPIVGDSNEDIAETCTE